MFTVERQRRLSDSQNCHQPVLFGFSLNNYIEFIILYKWKLLVSLFIFFPFAFKRMPAKRSFLGKSQLKFDQSLCVSLNPMLILKA